MSWYVLVDGNPGHDSLQVLVGAGRVAVEVALGLRGVCGEEPGDRTPGHLSVEHGGGGVPLRGEDCGDSVTKQQRYVCIDLYIVDCSPLVSFNFPTFGPIY